MSASNNTTGPRWSGRRAHAARMLAAGVSMARVSSALGLSPATARRYERTFAAGGVDALLALGDVGRQSRLSVEALEQVIHAIKQAPGRVGMHGQCWTNALVQQFIEQVFSISYSHSHINRLIRDHGLQHWMSGNLK